MPLIHLASTSPIKRQAVANFFGVHPDTIVCHDVDVLDLPPQPVGCGEQCALTRVNHVAKMVGQPAKDIFVALENAVTNYAFDYAFAVVKVGSQYHQGQSNGVWFDAKFLDAAKIQSTRIEDYRLPGMDVTVGQAIHQDNDAVNPKDWVGARDENGARYNLNYYSMDADQVHNTLALFHAKQNHYKSRLEQLESALLRTVLYSGNDKFSHHLKNLIAARIRVVPDFPKPGVLFKDLSPMLADDFYSQLLFKCMNRDVQDRLVDKDWADLKVVGLESRGYIFGSVLAKNLGAGFVPVKKPGKIPTHNPAQDILSVTYEKEYGTDTLQLLKESIQPGDKVIIVDDLLATGGSLAAARQLVEAAGGTVIMFVVMLGVEPLLEQAKKVIGAGPGDGGLGSEQGIDLVVVLP